ncbi:MAG TPA: SulP family inorganic anion transporter, partial [Acidimicrobiales bacterium]|nr:SulP family inorganic anion transporter [Acidimicrobiales bacterium]
MSVAAPKQAKTPAWVTRFVPIVSWLPRYQLSWLSSDAVAGFTIWGLLIPEMIAYASLAGLSPQAGLYTLLASLALYAIFGTSRHLVVAATSASAVLIYSAVTTAALSPDVVHGYATLAAGMILITGLFLVLAGMCKLGFITSFLSRPVMEGFIFGLAIFVSISQLPKLFGLKKGSGDSVRQLAHLIAHLGDTSLTTLAIGLLALAILFGVERYIPRVPGGLAVLVVGIALSAGLNLSHHGVDTVGKIPTGLPSVAWPHLNLSELWVLIPSSIGMMLVIFSEALGAGQNFADKHGYRLVPDQEMIALGLANIGSAFLGGLACGGSLSQTAVNDGAGARTEVSPLVAAVLSLVTVVALTPLFTDLPEAVLAALIIHAVYHLMKVAEMRQFYRLKRREFWLAMATLVAVITLDVLPALIIGIVFSLAVLIYRASRPRVSVLGTEPARPGTFEDIERHPDAVPVPGVLVVRPDAPLFYANAQAVRDAVEADVGSSSSSVKAVVFDLDANDEIDITSAEQLGKLAESLGQKGVDFALAHVHDPVEDMARATGLLEKVGQDRIFPSVAAA